MTKKLGKWWIALTFVAFLLLVDHLLFLPQSVNELCRLEDFPDISDSINCVPFKPCSELPTNVNCTEKSICVRPLKADSVISGNITLSGSWELEEVSLVVTAMHAFPKA